MSLPKLQPGDIFFVHGNRTLLQKCINLVQGTQDLWDHDQSSASDTAHCGIIRNEQGETFESKLRIGTYHLNGYRDKELSIYRHGSMNDARYLKGMWAVLRHKGQIYPVHRLPLHMIPGLAARFVPFPKPVCSELAAKFLYHAELLDDNYWGINVDMLFDNLDTCSDYKIVFNGVWK